MVWAQSSITGNAMPVADGASAACMSADMAAHVRQQQHLGAAAGRLALQVGQVDEVVGGRFHQHRPRTGVGNGTGHRCQREAVLVSTVSPGFTPTALSATNMAAPQELTATQYVGCPLGGVLLLQQRGLAACRTLLAVTVKPAVSASAPRQRSIASSGMGSACSGPCRTISRQAEFTAHGGCCMPRPSQSMLMAGKRAQFEESCREILAQPDITGACMALPCPPRREIRAATCPTSRLAPRVSRW